MPLLRARDNPFRVEQILAIRYAPQETTWDDLLARLQRLNFHGAICGPEGSGKTTLLEDLAARLRASGRRTRWLQLRRELRSSARRRMLQFLQSVAPDEILLVDGAEQLGLFSWRTLKRRAERHAGLIVTLHRRGRLPTLVDCRTSLKLLESIVAQLVPNDSADLRAELPALFDRHDGNIRLCLRSLYDRYSSLPTSSMETTGHPPRPLAACNRVEPRKTRN